MARSGLPRLHGMALAIALSAAPIVAFAQEAVPLTPELFELQWVAVEYDGKLDDVDLAPTTLHASDGHAGGQTACGNNWSAKIEIDLPSVKFSDVDAFYEDSCPAYRNTIALLNALEQVSYAQTTPEGLELRAEDDRVLLLLVAGG